MSFSLILPPFLSLSLWAILFQMYLDINTVYIIHLMVLELHLH